MAASWVTRLDGGPRRVNHAAVMLGNRMYMIGGYYTGLQFNSNDVIDVFVFSLTTLKWNGLIVNNQQAPFMRYGHTAVVYGTDIYVWGGRNDIRACNKLFKFDAVLQKWSEVGTRGEPPSPRDGHSACLMGSRMYIFGGFLDEPLNVFATGMHAIDLETMTWEYVHAKGEEPECRDFHGSVVVGRKMYLFGGRGTNTPPYHSQDLTYPNTLHVWDDAAREWSTKLPTAKSPVGRRSLSMFVHGTDIYVFGGFNARYSRHFNDVHKYCTLTDEWSPVSTHGTAPCPRRRQTCLVAGNRVFVYGGTSPENPLAVGHQDDEASLQDHSDLHILDLRPTLRTLCLTSVIHHQLETQSLPSDLSSELLTLAPHPMRRTTRQQSDGPMPRRRRRR